MHRIMRATVPSLAVTCDTHTNVNKDRAWLLIALVVFSRHRDSAVGEKISNPRTTGREESISEVKPPNLARRIFIYLFIFDEKSKRLTAVIGF